MTADKRVQYHPHEVDVEGLIDDRDGRYIKYFGKAVLQENGMFRCVAALSPCGPLCVVEARITTEVKKP